MATSKPTWEDLLPSLQMEAVAEAILKPKLEGGKPPQFSNEDFETIKSMVWAAGKRWAVFDLQNLHINSIEARYDRDNIKAFLDLDVAVSQACVSKPFDVYKQKRMVVDWKSRQTQELDARWKDRLVDSWQWRIYCWMTGAELFWYRGISGRCDDGGDCSTKDVIIKVPETNNRAVEEYLAGVFLERNSLITNGLEIWPRHSPDACNAWGRECPFKNDCDSDSMPRFALPDGKQMSYTSLHLFTLCPERSRRTEGLKDMDEDGTLFGSQVHAALAVLWEQLRNIDKSKFV